MHRKEVWAVLIVVVAVAAVLLYTAAHAVGQILAFQNGGADGNAAIDDLSGVNTSTWQAYNNAKFGFSLEYPSNWQLSTNGLSGSGPFIALGNPLSGTSTYVMDIFIENNSSSLSAGEYVHQLLAADKAEDAANAKNGPAPAVTPQFEKSYFTTVAGTKAYELFEVFEFDHNAERIYVANGNTVLRFDFPVADTNSNLSSPTNNNAIAHLILDTLTLQ
jgi:hypothetical protein